MPPELHVVGLDFTATPISQFVERPEYYSSQGNPDGLDPQRWRVLAADVDVRLVVDLPSQSNEVAHQRSNFVVAEDRSKSIGEIDKYALYSIELVSVLRKSTIPNTWGRLMSAFGGQCEQCPTPPAVSRVIDALAQAYRSRDLEKFKSLLHPDFVFSPEPVPNRPWGRAYEVRAHRRMFTPDDLAPGDFPVPASLRLQSIEISLEMLGPGLAGEYHALDATPTAAALSRRLWLLRARGDVVVHMSGPTDYHVASIQDLALAPLPEAPNSLRVISWYESATQAEVDLLGRSAKGVEAISWRALRRLYDGN
jgi:hypothetical protein